MTLEMSVIFAGCVLLLAGFVKGVIGLGLPTISVGLLGLIMSPVAAASLLVIPNLVTNAWQLWTGPSFAQLMRRLWSMLAGILVGTVLGAPLLEAMNGKAATGILGATLIGYGAIGLGGLTLSVPARLEPVLSPIVGIATGVISAVTGVFVVPAVPYLQALGLDKDDLVQALGLSFLVSTVAFAASLALAGLLQPTVATQSLLLLAPALIGMAIGTRVRALISATTFRRWFFVGLLVLGAYLVLRAAR